MTMTLPQSGASAKTTPESKCPELLANYCDMLLRKTPLSKVETMGTVGSKLEKELVKKILLIEKGKCHQRQG